MTIIFLILTGTFYSPAGRIQCVSSRSAAYKLQSADVTYEPQTVCASKYSDKLNMFSQCRIECPKSTNEANFSEIICHEYGCIINVYLAVLM